MEKFLIYAKLLSKFQLQQTHRERLFFEFFGFTKGHGNSRGEGLEIYLNKVIRLSGQGRSPSIVVRKRKV